MDDLYAISLVEVDQRQRPAISSLPGVLFRPGQPFETARTVSCPDTALWNQKPWTAHESLLAVAEAYEIRSNVIPGKPRFMHFDVVNACNLRCPACSAGLRVLDRKRVLAAVYNFQELLEAVGDNIFKLSLFNWGEPTLHKHFHEFARAASKRGVASETSSNLSLALSERQAEQLVSSGLTQYPRLTRPFAGISTLAVSTVMHRALS